MVAGDLLGVTGQTIKKWVRDEQLQDYRIGGGVVIPREAVVAYVARTGTSLDLEEFSDEEAAALVAEGDNGPHPRRLRAAPLSQF